MTDKLKCPFCGEELEEFTDTYFKCPNQKCMSSTFIFASREAWENIIVGKKAQDALKIAIQELNNLIEPVNNQDDYRNSVLTQFGLNRAINEIKRKITSITKQDNE